MTGTVDPDTDETDRANSSKFCSCILLAALAISSLAVVHESRINIRDWSPGKPTRSDMGVRVCTAPFRIPPRSPVVSLGFSGTDGAVRARARTLMDWISGVAGGRRRAPYLRTRRMRLRQVSATSWNSRVLLSATSFRYVVRYGKNSGDGVNAEQHSSIMSQPRRSESLVYDRSHVGGTCPPSNVSRSSAMDARAPGTYAFGDRLFVHCLMIWQ